MVHCPTYLLQYWLCVHVVLYVRGQGDDDYCFHYYKYWFSTHDCLCPCSGLVCDLLSRQMF